MIGTILTAIGGPIIKGIFGTVDQLVEDKDLATKIKSELQTKVLDIMETEIKAAASIIMAEINSDSYLAKNWRPMTMLTFVVIIANNYIFFPYLQLFFNSGAMLDIPPDMWDLLKLGLGGYVVGRSVEKGIKVWKDK
jgi:hypothetical protein